MKPIDVIIQNSVDGVSLACLTLMISWAGEDNEILSEIEDGKSLSDKTGFTQEQCRHAVGKLTELGVLQPASKAEANGLCITDDVHYGILESIEEIGRKMYFRRQAVLRKIKKDTEQDVENEEQPCNTAE